MISSFRALALVSTFVLASCGGGGGSSATGNAPSGPQSIAITETNAKPVAASALDTAQNISAGSVTDVPVGVQVDAGGAASANLQIITGAARFAASSFSAAALPVGVAVSKTVNCALGGTASISGNVANSNGPTAGDSLTLVMSSCTETAGTTLSGQLALSVASGSLTSVPFHIVLAMTATNLTATRSGTTTVVNGDIRLDWTASSTSDSMVATGSVLSTRETLAGSTHTTTLRNFTQALTIDGTTLSSSVSATVETDNSRLGGTTVTYTISTPTPVVWNESTRTATAGVVKVVGANNAQLVLTVNAGGSVTLQLDANGDGVFEKTITTTTTELAGLV